MWTISTGATSALHLLYLSFSSFTPGQSFLWFLKPSFTLVPFFINENSKDCVPFTVQSIEEITKMSEIQAHPAKVHHQREGEVHMKTASWSRPANLVCKVGLDPEEEVNPVGGETLRRGTKSPRNWEQEELDGRESRWQDLAACSGRLGSLLG